MIKPVHSYHPPAIVRRKGITYIVGGDVTLKLDHDITRDELHKYMIRAPISTDLNQDKSDTEWEVTGSKGNKYTVRLFGGSLSCTCMGFGFRRKCKHVTSKKKELEIK